LVKYRVTVDRSSCIACGAAPAVCPEVFELGSDNGKSRVIEKYSIGTDSSISVGEVPEELYTCVKNAAEVCPVDAIKVEKVE